MSGPGKRVMVLSAGVGSGHNTAAAALEAEFGRRRNVEAVQRVDVLDLTSDLFRTLQDDAYFGLVDAAPWLVGWGYDMNDVPFRSQGAMSVWDQLNTTPVVKAIRAFAPDTVICTHFLPARIVSLLLGRGRLQATMSVVTTDYDFQGMWLTAPFNRLYVARDETRAHMVEIGLPADRITVSGIPVRAEFSEPIDRDSVLARHELQPDVPILLISAGAAGGEYTKAAVIQTLAIPNPFQAVVVCGRNEELRDAITTLVASSPGRYLVIGYTTEMAALMRVATLFIGKPGGLSSSECMAAGLPMVLINPIPGQEVRNSDFLLEEGAAIRCNYSTTIGYKIAMLLDAPDRVARMAANARRIGRPDAAEVIVSNALAETSQLVWISREARRVIRNGGQQGPSVHTRNAGGNVETVVDAATGVSVALVTGVDLRRIASLLPPGVSLEPELRVTSDLIAHLKHRRAAADAVAVLDNALGTADEVVLEVRREPKNVPIGR
ncbi:MAG TPA: glycosyltransferase [Candidatus Dormibacteraeota bacterium]